jgi:hypothetical protein
MTDSTTRRGTGTSVARWTLLFLVTLFTLGAMSQFFLVGLGMFEDGARWQDHRTFGYLVGMLTWIIWIPAVLGRAGRAVILGTVMLYVLFQAQYAFIHAGTGTMRALHPLNGTFLLLLGAWTTQRAFGLVRTPVEAPTKQQERRVSERYEIGKETA